MGRAIIYTRNYTHLSEYSCCIQLILSWKICLVSYRYLCLINLDLRIWYLEITTNVLACRLLILAGNNFKLSFCTSILVIILPSHCFYLIVIYVVNHYIGCKVKSQTYKKAWNFSWLMSSTCSFEERWTDKLSFCMTEIPIVDVFNRAKHYSKLLECEQNF